MQTLHREDIKAGIRKRYGTLKAFETARALPEGAVKGVLFGKSSTRTVAAIAEVLELPVDVIQASVKADEKIVAEQHKSTEVDSHEQNTGE